MKLQVLVMLCALFTIISCGDDESDNSETNTDEETCAGLEEAGYEAKITQVIIRDDSGEECPMLTPEGFASSDDTDDMDDDITTCVSEYEDDPEFVCRGALRCTTTQPSGLTVEYAAIFTTEEDNSFTGVLDFEVNGTYCSYAIAGNLETP